MRIVKLSPHGAATAITVPRPYLRQLGWCMGDYILLLIQDGELHCRRLNLPELIALSRDDRDRHAAQANPA
jgi:antitoxin component of MazEF toxin-antitoxin module